MVYVATPYSHPDSAVMEDRFRRACLVTAKLMNDGALAFSPIAHTHPIAVAASLPRGWDFWERYDRDLIALADRLIVVRMDGWESSRGVTAEIQIAIELGKEIEYIDE